MATVTVSFTTTPRSDIPNADKFTQYEVSIAGPDSRFVFVSFGTGPFTASFDNVAPGDYVAAAQLSNADGSLLDPGISTKFTVPPPPPPPVTVQAPDTITVALS